MTVPDSRPVLDVIAEAVAGHGVARFNVSHHHVGVETCPLPDSLTSDCPERRLECRCGQVMPHPDHRTHVAAAVLAACQGATVEQQAELLGGDMEWWSFYENGKPYSHIRPYRDFVNGSVTPPAQIAAYLVRDGTVAKCHAVGPWREDPS